jgi:hypothetical protein
MCWTIEVYHRARLAGKDFSIPKVISFVNLWMKRIIGHQTVLRFEYSQKRNAKPKRFSRAVAILEKPTKDCFNGFFSKK